MADSKRICSVDGCDKSGRLTRGMCVLHYKRFLRHGDPLAGRTQKGVPLKWIEDNKNHKGDECLAWPFYISPSGYGRINMGGSGSWVAARVMCQASHGPAPTPDHQAAHSCGKGHRGCVNPKHLYWATPVENAEDKIGHGTHKRGEDCHTARLTKAQVVEIRARVGSERGVDLAAEFGVSQMAISDIKNRRRWGWLDDEIPVRDARCVGAQD